VQTHLARLASEAQRVAVVVDAAQAALGEQDDPQLDPALTGAACTLAGRRRSSVPGRHIRFTGPSA